MIVRYTAEQLALDSDKIFSITEKVARRVLNQLQVMGYLEELEKGKKGTYTKWKICKERVVNGQETGTYWAGNGQELGTNDKAMPTVTEVEGQELGRKRAGIGQETVSPISNKENKKESKKIFIPPTLDEITEYINEKQYSVDPKRFFDYFEAGNWHDSQGKPVKSWKQKMVTWDKKDNSKVNGINQQKKPHAVQPAEPIRMERRKAWD